MKDSVAVRQEVDWSDQCDNSGKMIDAIINSSRAYIVFITPDFRVRFYNRKAWQSSKILFGLDLQLGSDFREYLNQLGEEIAHTFKENFTKVILEGGTLATDREMHYHDVKGWIRTEYTPVYDERVLIGVSLRVVDITERKERELQIEQQNEKLSEIAWIQSHETRQPLASALGLLHILDRQSLTPDNQKIIALLDETIHKLDVVIRDTVVKANSMCQHKFNRS